MERRIRRLGVFMVLCFLALFVQLNNIQVLKAGSLANNQNNPRVVAVARSQPRGAILTADGVKLAYSVLAPKTSAYKYQRQYNPNTAVLFSQIVGYDSLIYGTSGIEAEYDSYLKAHTRQAKTLRDLLVNRTTTDNVTLTIDSHLQLEVASILDTKIIGNPSVSAAVVIDPKTGAIRAMYSNPTYDPTPLTSPDGATETAAWKALTTDPTNPMLSRAYQRSYEPGSTFKVVTSSAIYDHQPALATLDYPLTQCIPLPQSPLTLCNYGRNTPAGPEHCGGTIQQALPASCDTSFARYGMALDAGPLYSEATAFGFNQRIPLDLPYVPPSNFPSLAQLTNNKPKQAYSAFGQQDVSATTLQMALVVAGIANKGTIMTPHLMQDIRDSQGNLVTSYTPKPWLRATSPQTAASVTSLMQGVVNLPIGTAYGVFPASEDVAAKTGTAETGPNGSLTNDWMVAFAPANDPKVAVAVAVPNQPGSATGAQTSGPPTQLILAAALAAAS